MSWFKLDLGDLVEDFGLPGLAIGAGAIVLAPFVSPPIAKVGKGVAKAALKSGIVVYEKTRSAFAEAGEAIEDMIAESKAELAQAQEQKALTTEGQSETS
jgi:hypothetical protein